LLGLFAWVMVYGVGLESTTAAVAALVATLASVVVGLVAVRRAKRRSPEFFMGIGGAALGGLVLLQAALLIVFTLLGWMEWR
jgi:drug/metabolite transporter (DMT)-like permease